MNAIIKPLDGKYYGTVVEITDGPYAGHEVVLWISVGKCDLEPSIRELDKYGITQEQWNENPKMPDYEALFLPGSPITAREVVDICDSHFEGRVAYEAALGLIDVLKKIK
jgi:hypothetical protein